MQVEHTKSLDTIRRQSLWITVIREGKKVQANIIENMLNKIKLENYPNLGKHAFNYSFIRY
jgi:hypothetical protein